MTRPDTRYALRYGGLTLALGGIPALLLLMTGADVFALLTFVGTVTGVLLYDHAVTRAYHRDLTARLNRARQIRTYRKD